MKKKEILFLIIGLLAGVVITLIIAKSMVSSNNTAVMSMMGMRSQKQIVMGNSDTVDKHFIEQMIPHHEDAITMSKLAMTKAKRPEVKELAGNIIDSQGKEITQMKLWYKNWFARDVPSGDSEMSQHAMPDGSVMHMGKMGKDTDMMDLEEAEDFDREFVRDMIPHHQMAVMMANMLKNSTVRPEMKKLADDIIKAQTDEIETMREWLNEWEV